MDKAQRDDERERQRKAGTQTQGFLVLSGHRRMQAINLLQPIHVEPLPAQDKRNKIKVFRWTK